MDLYYKQEVSVGLLVLVALSIFVGGIIWLTGSPLFTGSTTRVEVRFDDVTGLQPGDPVHVSGVRVGRVESISLEDVGRILVRIEVPRDLQPRADASATIGSLDFLGAKFVDYRPGTSATMLADGQILSGSTAAGLTDNVPELADRAAGVLTGLETLVSREMRDELRLTMGAARQAMNVIEEVGDGPAVEEATAAMSAMRGVLERLDSTLAASNLDSTFAGLAEAAAGAGNVVEGLTAATTTLNSMLDRIDRGEGLVGKVMTDSTLHTDMHLLLVSMRQLLDDMRERPGRYFRLTVF